MKQQVVFFEGPSCAGKSTAVDTLFKNYQNTFCISKDTIKRLISNYSHQNEGQRLMLEKILINMCEISINNGMSLFIESQKQLIDEILKIIEGKNIDIKYINIEAPLNVLEKRFKERKKILTEKGINVTYTYNDLLLEIYNNYQKNKFTNGITIDTDKLSKSEVVDEIEKYIGIPEYE